MNKLARALMALFFFCVLYSAAESVARATTITVPSQTVPNFQARSSGPVFLRIFLNRAFVANNGTGVAGTPLQPSSPSSNNYYLQLTCTLAGTTLTIPSFTIDSTTDGLDINTATYSAYFFDSTGAQIGVYAGFEQFRVPFPVVSASGCSPAGTCATWADLRAYSFARVQAPDNSAYTKSETLALINANIAGQVPFTAPFILKTPVTGLNNAQALSALPVGSVMKTAAGGAVAPAIAGTDYLAGISGTAPITVTGGNTIGVQSSNLQLGPNLSFSAGGGSGALLGASGATIALGPNVVVTNQANSFGAFLQTFQAGVNFNLVDPADTTKRATFGLSNITPGQTRNVNIPDAASTTVQASSAPANQFATGISAQGVVSYAQPGFGNLSGTAAKGQLPGTTVYADQANTYSAGAQDFSSAASFKFPIGAGLQPSVNGQVAYDSTANRFGGGVAGVYALLVHPASADVFTNKTYDTAGAGNVFRINGTQIMAVSGSGAVAMVNSPAFTTPSLGAATAASITGLTGSLTPNAAGGIAVGSASLPFSSIWIGAAATNNIQVTGTATAARVFTLPDANSNPVQPSSAGANQFATGISSAGVITYAQPGFGNLSGTISTAQLGTTDTPQFAQVGVNQAAAAVASVAITGASINAQASLSVASIQSGGNFISNDNLTKTFYDHLMLATLNFGNSNANKTVSLLRLDTINTNVTGITAFNLIDANYGGANQFKLDSGGNGTFAGNVVASGGKFNKVTVTQPATGSTLTIADGKTFTVNNTLTLAGTDSTTLTFQGTDTYVGRATTDTLTNKTLGNPTTITGPVTMTLGSDATGDVYYRNSSGVLTRLGVGSAGQFLGVSGGLPAWATPTGSGTVNSGTAGNLAYYASSSAAVSTVPGTSFNATNQSMSWSGAAIPGGANLWTWTPGGHGSVTSEVNDLLVAAHTMTVTTGFTNQRFTRFAQPTISSPTAQTINGAATVAIDNAPAAAGSAALGRLDSNPPLAFWVLDGGVRFGPANGTNGGGSQLTWNPYSTDQSGNSNSGDASLLFEPNLADTTNVHIRGMEVRPTIGSMTGAVFPNNVPASALGIKLGNPSSHIAAGTKRFFSAFEVDNFDSDQTAADENGDSNDDNHGFGFTGAAHGAMPMTAYEATITNDTVSSHIRGVVINLTQTVAEDAIKSSAFVATSSGSQNASYAYNIFAGAKFVHGFEAHGFDLDSVTQINFATTGNVLTGYSLVGSTLNQGLSLNTNNNSVSAEASDFIYNAPTLNVTAALNPQRFWKIGQPTITASTPQLLANTVTFDIVGAPIAGSNATFASNFALRIEKPITGNGASLGMGALSIFSNGAGLGGSLAQGQIWTQGSDGAANLTLMDAYGAGNLIQVRRADGTGNSPTGVAAGENLLQIVAYGLDNSTAFGQATNLKFVAAETFTNAAHGGYVSFNTTARGTTVLTEQMRLMPEGQLLLNGFTGTTQVAVGDLASQNAVAFVVKGNKLNITYNAGGTQRWLHYKIDGTGGGTWTDDTTAP